jgi:hypothetical protein
VGINPALLALVSNRLNKARAEQERGGSLRVCILAVLGVAASSSGYRGGCHGGYLYHH